MRSNSLHRFYVAEIKHLHQARRLAAVAPRNLAEAACSRLDGAPGRGPTFATPRADRLYPPHRGQDRPVADEFGGSVKPTNARNSARSGSEIPKGRRVSKCVTTR